VQTILSVKCFPQSVFGNIDNLWQLTLILSAYKDMSKTLTDKPDPPPQDLGVNIPWSVT